ncbi:MAG: hypothetical protein SGPRY_014523, partial [Prymnesium sp.]
GTCESGGTQQGRAAKYTSQQRTTAIDCGSYPNSGYGRRLQQLNGSGANGMIAVGATRCPTDCKQHPLMVAIDMC